MTLSVLLLTASSFLACAGSKDSATDTSSDVADTDTDTDTDADTDTELAISGSWSGDGKTYTLVITNGSGNYNLGMAETGAGADGWYGEDCIEGACHPATSTGLTLTHVATIPEVVPGSTTLLSGELDANITYGVIDSTGACWAWGNDVSYYPTCTAM
jgi:hypothetical protein